MELIHSEYLHLVFDPEEYKETLVSVMNCLETIEYEAIAFRGSSGAAVAFPLSLLVDKPLIQIRKNTGHHAKSLYEGVYGIKSYVIVDDFMESGETIVSVVKQVEKFHRTDNYLPPKCNGVIFYNGYKEMQVEWSCKLNEVLGKTLNIYCLREHLLFARIK
jgi:hypothetical protein